MFFSLSQEMEMMSDDMYWSSVYRQEVLGSNPLNSYMIFFPPLILNGNDLSHLDSAFRGPCFRVLEKQKYLSSILYFLYTSFYHMMDDFIKSNQGSFKCFSFLCSFPRPRHCPRV